jgi:hypothetical protein|nr:MAG TPA: hypothetical protein [Caudoviricetes sp.]
MEIIELDEQAGFMYVNATHRIIAYFVYCPDAAAKLWVLTPEDEALALEAQWRAEAEAKAKAEEGEAQP